MASIGVMPELDQVIQVGRGVAAAVIGQTYGVYRLNNTTQQSVTSNPPVAGLSAFPCRFRRTTSKLAIENEVYSLICFQGTCDNRQLAIGDLLYETGYEAMDAGYYTYAQARPTRESLFMSTPFTATLTRMHPHAGQAEQQPTEPGEWIDLDGYGGPDRPSESVLVLQNGFYSYQNNANLHPASVQVGMQPIRRIRDGNSLGTPGTDMFRVEYLFYCPELPGEQINELDRFNLGSSDRYEVSQIYSSEYTGLAGNICVAEKTGS